MKYNERWISAFVSGTRREQIMLAAGIGKTRYYRLRADQEFMRIVTQRRNEITKEAVLKMQSYLCEDVEILQGIIRSGDTADQVRVNAIQLLLNQFNAYWSLTELQERIEILEKIAGEHDET